MSEFRNHNEERRNRWEARWQNRMEHHDGKGHIWTGMFLLAIGGLALARSMGAPIPNWLFSWQMLLIAIGLFIGFKKGFREGGWFVPILIGGAFLANDYILEGDLRSHIWPLILIILGAIFILRPRNRHCRGFKKKEGIQAEANTPLSEESYTRDDIIDSTNIFSGTKKVILSKNFKGGDIVNIFGGSEIDLTQADITTPAVLEVTAIFGGATLIVPSNWAIKSEAVTIFGGIGDKRKLIPSTDSPTKTLILKGTMIFGGMEIKSY
jgi:predicted membrane protein